MSAHDQHLAQHRVEHVEVTCTKCETSWHDRLESEYGQSWLTVCEECPNCNAYGDDLAVG